MTSEPTVGQLFCDEMIGLLEQAMIKVRHVTAQLEPRQIWSRQDETQNSIGNLMLHVAGNLRQWVIAGVGLAVDERHRQNEFDERREIDLQSLLAQLDQTVGEARSVIAGLDAEQLQELRTIQGFDTRVLSAIAHSVTHFVGHTHQVIMLGRQILGADYRFHWSPEDDRGATPI